jgi:hypothetical protein
MPAGHPTNVWYYLSPYYSVIQYSCGPGGGGGGGEDGIEDKAGLGSDEVVTLRIAVKRGRRY